MQGVEGYRARVTPTHAGVDSRGVMKVLGLELEGASYITLVIGVGCSMFAGVLTMFMVVPVIVKVLVAASPAAGSIGFHLLFIQGKPPAYRADLLSTALDGKHFFTKPHKWTKRPHPLGLSVRNNIVRTHGGAS